MLKYDPPNVKCSYTQIIASYVVAQLTRATDHEEEETHEPGSHGVFVFSLALEGQVKVKG
jgi:hypothetical protein